MTRHQKYLARHSQRSEEPLNKFLECNDAHCLIVRAAAFNPSGLKTTTMRSLVVFATRDDTSQRPAKILEAVQPFFDYIKTGGVAKPDCAIVSESRSGNNCYIRLTQ